MGCVLHSLKILIIRRATFSSRHHGILAVAIRSWLLCSSALPVLDLYSTYYEVSCHKSGVIEYLKKGTQVFATGRLLVSNREKDGKTYTNLYVTASQVCLCSTPRN